MVERYFSHEFKGSRHPIYETGFVCVYVEPDAATPADAGADANAGAAGSVSAELGSDQRNIRGDHGTLHAAHRAGPGAPQQEEPHHRGQRAPDRLPGVCTHTRCH